MKLFAVVALILGMTSPVFAGGAFDNYMQGSSWMSQMLTNDEMQRTMRQQRELQQRQIEEMDRQKANEGDPEGLKKIDDFIAARPEYRDNWKMRTCLLSLALKIMESSGYRVALDNALMWADDNLQKMIVTEAARLNAKK